MDGLINIQTVPKNCLLKLKNTNILEFFVHKIGNSGMYLYILKYGQEGEKLLSLLGLHIFRKLMFKLVHVIQSEITLKGK